MITATQPTPATLEISLPRRGIGYIRVSSDLQANDGRSLDRQLGVLREWCALEGWALTHIFEDVGSAVGEENLRGRPEFEQAVNEALREGVPLVVTDVTRISRDPGTLERAVIERGLTVISVEDGGEVPVAVLRQRVENGAQQAARISEGTRRAIASKAPRRAPDSAVRRQAARRSAMARIAKKNAVLDQVVDAVEREPWLENATSREMADQINSLGILTGWGRPWTASSVRAKRQTIKDELIFRREMEMEDADGGSVLSGEKSSPVAGASMEISTRTPAAAQPPTLAPLHESQSDAEGSGGLGDEEEDEMRKNRFFAMF